MTWMSCQHLNSCELFCLYINHNWGPQRILVIRQKLIICSLLELLLHVREMKEEPAKPEDLPHPTLVRGEWVPRLYCLLFSWYRLCSGYFLRGIDVWHKDLHTSFRLPWVHPSVSWSLPQILSSDFQPYFLQAPCLDKLFATSQEAVKSLPQATSLHKVGAR